MTKLLIALAAALSLSCSDRVADEQVIKVVKYDVVGDSMYLDQVVIGANDFANWVKKSHPDIWLEYYNTAIGDSL